MSRMKELALDIEESITRFCEHFSLDRLPLKELLALKETLDHCTEQMQAPSHDLWLAVIKQTPAPPKPRYTYKRRS